MAAGSPAIDNCKMAEKPQSKTSHELHFCIQNSFLILITCPQIPFQDFTDPHGTREQRKKQADIGRECALECGIEDHAAGTPYSTATQHQTVQKSTLWHQGTWESNF